jgi:CDP-diacylglycerol--glycerol-3-phosphate 3-phosphatidyltransferase
MSTRVDEKPAAKLFNVPNQLTAARLLLSIVLFVVIGIAQGLDPAARAALQSNLFLAALVLFVVAAGTDWIDGYWARKYGQITVLGRISDPFADKIIICGTFIFLVASPASRVAAWMAVVIVGRELLVTALRGFFEQQGTDFSANMSGKLKMVVQCAAAVACLFLLTYTQDAPPQWLDTTVLGLVWATVAITVYSGVVYIVAAVKLLNR